MTEPIQREHCLKPVVSVVILSYNQAEYLIEAVESVIAQTFPDWELILIDNGSTDDSRKLLQRYVGNPKIQLVFHDSNDRLTIRLNQGIQLSKGEYVSLLYSDDFYLPDKLEKQIACFAGLAPDWGLVYSPCYDLNELSGVRSLKPSIKANGYILNDLLTRFFEGFINPITPLIRRECFVKNPFCEEFFVEGEDIYFRMALSYKFFYLEEPLAVMREHGKNMRFAGKRNAEISDTNLARLEMSVDFPEYCRPALRILRGRLLRNYAWQNIRMAPDAYWARGMFRRAIRVDWRQLFAPKTVLGWMLSYMPKSILGWLNPLLNRVRQKQGVYLEDYSR